VTLPHPLFEMVARLENLWLDPETSDIVHLSRLLEQRQGILTELQNADTTELDPGAREALSGRIRAVHERDERLLEVMRRRCDGILEALEAVVHVRTAVRGYRPGEGERTHVLERIA
jgi:hypothetical protein